MQKQTTMTEVKLIIKVIMMNWRHLKLNLFAQKVVSLFYDEIFS
mgnify:CR=1 FL=1